MKHLGPNPIGNGKKQVMKEGQIRSVKRVVFVPSTEKSQLKEILQKADDQMTKILKTSAICQTSI